MENNKKIVPFPKISSLNTWQIYPYKKFFAIKRSADRKPTASELSTNARSIGGIWWEGIQSIITISAV
jgi:hypothetical protein